MSGWLELTPQDRLLLGTGAPRARERRRFPTSEQDCALERVDLGGEPRPAEPKSATDIGRKGR
jgi:hypothetical protein